MRLRLSFSLCTVCYVRMDGDGLMPARNRFDKLRVVDKLPKLRHGV